MNERVAIAAEAELEKRVILLVEDEVLVRLVTAEVLRDGGYIVLEAVDAAEALAIIATGHPIDAVITDIRMPGPIDGLQLAVRIKSQVPNLPVAILSSHLPEGSHNRADAFISKPYEPELLLKLIGGLVDRED